MNKKYYIIILFLIPVAVLGQFNPQLSQLIKTLEFINPGYNASKDLSSASLLYRNQWTGLKGSPQTIAANVHVPVNKWHAGFGLNAISQSRGLIDHSNFDLSGCVDVKTTTSSYLTFGLSGGAELKQIDMANAIYDDEIAFLSDEFNHTTVHTGFGLNYFTPRLHLGLSLHYSLLDGRRYTAREQVTSYINANYLIPLNNNWVLKPSALVKTWGEYTTAEAGIFALYNDILWSGISYRLGNAIIIFADVKISEMLRIGYCYDFGVTGVTDFNIGSHEIRLEFTAPRAKKTNDRMAFNN